MRVASKVGKLRSKFGHAIGLWVLELFATYATDGQTDGRTKNNAFCEGVSIDSALLFFTTPIEEYDLHGPIFTPVSGIFAPNTTVLKM